MIVLNSCGSKADIYKPRDQKNYLIPLEKIALIKLGETTEDDLYKLATDKIILRYSFPGGYRKKLGPGDYIEIDKLIVYHGGISSRIESSLAVTNVTRQTLTATFYLYKNIVIHYSIHNRDWDNHKSLPPSTRDIITYDKLHPGAFWPYQECDTKYYETVILKVPEEKRRLAVAKTSPNLQNCD